ASRTRATSSPARAAAPRAIAEKKIDTGWQAAGEPAVEQKPFNGRPAWVVTFRHPAPADKKKSARYIVLTPTGRFVAANHTGR
ncbi:MAG: hypothetical protein FJ027_14895, partial [Candidatus Rokubacteria bacterium]|nr:hypothetical protein [Candidatus Rokubacteria bacterium]